jgi:hypothetical protein
MFQQKEPTPTESHATEFEEIDSGNPPSRLRKFGKVVAKSALAGLPLFAAAHGIYHTMTSPSEVPTTHDQPAAHAEQIPGMSDEEHDQLKQLEKAYTLTNGNSPTDIPETINWQPGSIDLVNFSIPAGEGIDQAATEAFVKKTGHEAPQTVTDSITVSAHDFEDSMRDQGLGSHPQPNDKFHLNDIQLNGQERIVITPVIDQE